jgi:high-affinity Fe2+/Pb2+ permease
MKIDMKKSVPNVVVYAVLYATVFGICIWLLVSHNESPTNWVLYTATIWSVLAGLVKFALHSRKRRPQSSIR